MPTHEYKLEVFVDVEYEFHEWVKPKPYADVVGEDAWVEILGPEWLFSIPEGPYEDMREHILQSELSGPDPDKEADRRRDDGEM